MYGKPASTPASAGCRAGSAGPSTINFALVHDLTVDGHDGVSFGIRNIVRPSMSDDQTLLALVSLPNDTVPVFLGEHGVLQRALRTIPATRGRPPVMSRVFEVSIGIRASMSPPTLTS